MSVKIYPNTKVYVVAPANTATGGPELLQQLVYHLRNNLNIDAYIYYVPSDLPDPVHPEYKQYNNPYVRKIEDEKENLLIVPEVIGGIRVLSRYSEIRKVIWWLSVDNFYISAILKSKRAFFFRRVVNKISKLILNKTLFDINELTLKKITHMNLFKFDQVRQVDFHLAQSYYAIHHLESNGIPKNKIFYLSDYLNENFLKIQTDLLKKENIVVYNPKKGFSFTKKIIKNAPGIRFVPLVNMTRQQVIETLQKAKVYIDFGNHPGKDRIPREAAILGCCVITGKRGSAKYFEDVPISEEYKFYDKEENIPKIINKIKDCFENFEERYKDFNYYREVIKNELQKFLEDLKSIFRRED
ncbi:hypothetical protein Dester_1361 [Desulfurobacterium thermolithotrophum DSM 11699]|uniref:Glycosyl transferase group 1 n=1 Tax=Desulfurobacterium thermolithotrophum (strain DSM 11699 / BSA) TaxID=868864 RepID=F0S1I9_DESTD|nr:hypothetical protein [Desulfurobacterium thermolithotrophum]ADY73992.1 hypothetical protein Dester_1361 [Desulfurobacterium thermolithotrophum DSM 11699]